MGNNKRDHNDYSTGYNPRAVEHDLQIISQLTHGMIYNKKNLTMQQAQEIYGYLPIEVQTMISDETGIPLEKIYGVSTFYSQFALQPKGKYQISVCLGTACYVTGSGAIFSKLEELLGITNGECTPDGRFSLDSCRCVGACGLAPVMMINDEVYGRLTVDDIDDILAK